MLAGPLDTSLYRFLRRVVPPLTRLLYRLEVRGVENVPRQGAVVLAANHLSNVDPIFIGVASPRQVHFMAKSELWKFKPLGRLIDLLGSFPVRRGTADREAVRRALDVLSKGAVLGIFPEGHRQPAGRLGIPQPGFALFSLQSSVVTVPVALTGTDRIMRGRLPAFPRITVTFGTPMAVQSVQKGTKAAAHREVAELWVRSENALLGHGSTDTDPAIEGSP